MFRQIDERRLIKESPLKKIGGLSVDGSITENNFSTTKKWESYKIKP